jgi:hypothetical protein
MALGCNTKLLAMERFLMTGLGGYRRLTSRRTFRFQRFLE